ncbi:N-terminal methyltransferase [Lycorma delicatula]|uniref:N-terminal methyltransferase n=1 Tax=Lycorma delicatula TaxID=130591 RepID=UPI003F50F88E
MIDSDSIKVQTFVSTNSEKVPNYERAAKYWSKIPATVDGMLVGFGFVSDVDIKGSDKFLKSLFQMQFPPGKERALDCGAGIGRISKNLLTKHFNIVDLVEQNRTFIEEAKSYIGQNERIGNFYNIGLQNFKPSVQYDVIWSQWVLGHLRDEDLIEFLIKCRDHLMPGGVIVVKENLTSSDSIEMDEEDSSVTRPYSLMQKLFTAAGLTCICETKQKNFPKFLYRVDMFALRPTKLLQNEATSQ